MSKAGPQTAGYTSGGWHTPMLPDLIPRRFGVSDHPPSLATLLHHRGFASQKARCVSDHLKAAQRLAGCRPQWPKLVHHARQRQALLLFGAEASLAPGGSLSYPWAPTGQQPEVPPSGKRKGYKVLGLLDSCSGRLCDKGQAGRLNSESYAALLRDVLSQTRCHGVVMQDGAR